MLLGHIVLVWIALVSAVQEQIKLLIAVFDIDMVMRVPIFAVQSPGNLFR